MGVKSTTHLTRVEAEAKYVELSVQRARIRFEETVRTLSNASLESILENLNDDRVNRETGTLSGGFDNYNIVEG